MKKILSTLLAVIVLATSLAFGTFTASAKGTSYTIKKYDRSASFTGGSIKNYATYPVFRGSSKSIKKINKSLKSFAISQVKSEDSASFREDINSYYEEYGSKVTYYNAMKSKVTYNTGKVISVKHKLIWYMGGTSSGDFLGSTYSRKTGKELKLYQVVPKKYNPKTSTGFDNLRYKIWSELYDKYGYEVAEEFLNVYNTRTKLSNAKFYINGNGKVVVCFLKYDISYGANGCLSIAVPSKY